MFTFGGTGVNPNVSEIEWCHLMSPKDKDGHEIKVQLGQGVFGQFVKKYYRVIPVAVKLFNHLSSSQDESIQRSYAEQKLKIPFVKQIAGNFAEFSSKGKCKPRNSEQLRFK